MHVLARAFGLVLLALVVASCGTRSVPGPAERYRQWLRAGHEAEVAAYAAYLRDQGAGNVLPLPELLRSGRRWHGCRTEEFSVPPRAQWPAMPSTLKLVAELRSTGMLEEARVASAWREPGFNRCEGGSSRSQHLENNALDFDVADGVDVAALCGYWRRHGAARRFGLGFYSPGAIHVDTAGFRTWGRDHHRGTSLCEQHVPIR